MFSRFFSSISSLLRTKHVFPIAFLSIVFLIIIGTNFPYHSWLIGWDNVLPELNFPLNFLRSFSTTWVSNQGLGHVGGHGHAANLPHTVILWLLRSIIPPEFLRSSITLLLYVSGAFGAYALACFLYQKKQFTRHASVLVALIYSFSLGTIQQFFTPLESFIIFHGLLPWVLLALFTYLDAQKLSARNMLSFLLLSWVFSSIGFLPPLFVVYGLVVGCIFGSYLLLHRSKKALQRVLLLGSIILIANLYWLNSIAYFTATSSSDYLNAQNNQLSTDGYNWQSIAYGGALDVALVRGFLYWALDSNNTPQTPLYVMQPWYEHYQNPLVVGVALLCFLLAMLGIVVSFRIQKQNYHLLGIVVIFLILLISLGQRIPGLATLSHVFKELPIVNQAFRAAFTKVSVPFVLMLALLAGHAAAAVLMSVGKKMKQTSTIVFGVLLVAVLGLGVPLFSGHLFSNHLKQTLPEEYSAVFAFLKQQPATERIAVLPLIEHWGWHYYDWGYIGSGFLWYGIEQPILDRSFDSWSRNNETFYAQLNAAVANRNESELLAILSSYQVSWLLLDAHLVKSSGDTVADELNFLSDLFAKLGFEAHSFGDITLFKNPTIQVQTHSRALIEASGDTTYTTHNAILGSLGAYISGTTNLFPFSQITSTHGLSLVDATNNYFLSGLLPTLEKNTTYTMHVPAVKEKILASTSVLLNDTTLSVTTTTQLPLLLLDQEILDANISKTNSFPLDAIELPSEYFLTIGDTVQDSAHLTTTTSETLVSFNPNYDLPVQLFSTETTKIADISEVVKWASLSNCASQQSAGKKYGTPTGTTVITARESGCFSAQIGTITSNPRSPGLYSLKFNYQLEQGKLEHLCLTRAEDTQKVCYSGELATNLAKTATPQETVVTFQLSQPGVYWLDFRVGAESHFTIKDVSLSERTRVFSNTIPAENWLTLQNEQQISLAHLPKKLTVQLPKDSRYSFDTAQVTSTGNCDVFNRGKITVTQKGDITTFTASSGAVACLPIVLADLDVSNLIVIQGTQDRGKSPEFTVGTLGKDTIDFELSPTGSFTMGIPRIRSGNNRETDQVTATTRSYSNTSTSSSLSNVSVIPVPLKWLSQLFLSTDESLALDIRTITTISTNNWIAKTHLSTPDQSLLVLDQSHDPAWIAFPSNRPWQLLDHRIYNGWANAWIVPAGTTAVTILFWPQLLSFFGYGVLIVAFFWLSIATLRQPTQSVTDPTKHSGGYVGSSKTLDYFVIRRFKRLRKKLLGE